MNIYEYAKTDGKWSREVIKSIEKVNLDNTNKTSEFLKEQTAMNLEYDFYSKFQPREDEWFYLNEKSFNLKEEAQKLILEIEEGSTFFFEESEDNIDEMKPMKMRLYSILGSAHNTTSIEVAEDYSELFNINERIDVLEKKLPYLGKFDRKPKYAAVGIGLVNEKKIIKSVINNEVRSIEDSVADLAKMNSLLFSCISAMYGTMSDSAKGKMDVETKTIIDYSVDKFNTTKTRGNQQLMEEGTDLVDKLFEREEKIADIIESVKA